MGNFNILLKSMILSWRKRFLAVRLWVINLIFSLFVVGPFFILMTKHMSHSFSGEHTLHKLDFFWLADFIYRYMNIAPALIGLILLAVVLYFMLTVFLNGGIISCLNRPETKTNQADFFHDCGLYFWRFFRLFLLSIPVYLMVLGIFYSMIKTFLEIFNRRAATEWPELIVSNLRILALVLLLTVVTMLLDYVKIGLVTHGQKKVLRETWQALKFSGRHFFKIWGLYLIAGLVFLALTIFYLEIARIFPKNRPLLVLLAFLWQQTYILGRQWSKLLFLASELEFVEQYREPSTTS